MCVGEHKFWRPPPPPIENPRSIPERHTHRIVSLYIRTYTRECTVLLGYYVECIPSIAITRTSVFIVDAMDAALEHHAFRSCLIEIFGGKKGECGKKLKGHTGVFNYFKFVSLGSKKTVSLSDQVEHRAFRVRLIEFCGDKKKSHPCTLKPTPKPKLEFKLDLNH